MPLDTPICKPAMSGGIWRRFAAACGLCIVGSAVFFTHRHETARQATVPVVDARGAEAPAVSPSATPTAGKAIPVEVSASLEPVPAREKIAPSSSQHARPSRVAAATLVEDTLAEELVLLTRATSQLSSGQASAALQTLDEHQGRFPRGVLSDERNAAKGRALCKLHRFDEGHAVLALLGAGTPFAARVKEECDSAASKIRAATASRKPTSD